MLSLAEVQRGVRDVVLGVDPMVVEPAIRDDGLGAANRLQVYRNNTTILLGEALSATFDVVRQLVGDDFFTAMAKVYLRRHPPRSPCLSDYGADFADFIDGFDPARGLPYLGDVARLEWAWNAAHHAPEARPLTRADFATVPETAYDQLRLTPHPSLRLLTSDYPVDALWAMHQDGADPEASLSLDQGGAALAVVRPGADVLFLSLSPDGYALTQSLVLGMSLGRAVSAVQDRAPNFDPTETLSTLIGGGAFTAFVPP